MHNQKTIEFVFQDYYSHVAKTYADMDTIQQEGFIKHVEKLADQMAAPTNTTSHEMNEIKMTFK